MRACGRNDGMIRCNTDGMGWIVLIYDWGCGFRATGSLFASCTNNHILEARSLGLGTQAFSH